MILHPASALFQNESGPTPARELVPGHDSTGATRLSKVLEKAWGGLKKRMHVWRATSFSPF
eukprot:12399586-Karenia_brevis.AAC.1